MATRVKVVGIRTLGRVAGIAAFCLAACGGSSGTSGAGGTTGATGGSGGTPAGSGGIIGSGAGGAGGASTGPSCHVPETLQVTNNGMAAYVIDGVSNPNLTFCRASTYVFAVNAPGHPFYINSVQGTGMTNAYNAGVTGNGTTSGNVTFVVPSDAPDTLFYNCSIHAAMTGTIHVVD